MTDLMQLKSKEGQALTSHSHALMRELEQCHEERNIALSQLLELQIGSESRIAELQAKIQQIEEISAGEHAVQSAQLEQLHHSVTERDAQIGTLQQSVEERDHRIEAMNQTAMQLDQQRQNLELALTECNHQITVLHRAAEHGNKTVREYEDRIASIYASSSWRITAPLRFVKRKCQQLLPLIATWFLGIYRGRLRWKTFRPIVAEWVRVLYMITPLPMPLKMSIKSAVFALCSPLFRNAQAYKDWVKFERVRSTHSKPADTAESASLLAATSALPIAFEAAGSSLAKELQQAPTAVAPTTSPQPEHPSFLDVVDLQTLVSVVIVNWNGLSHLHDLLSSLQHQTFSNFEIIFVDNASTDESVEFVRQNFPQVRVIALSENKGFAEANNIGFEQSRGTLVALLNNDTWVEPTFLAELVDQIRDPRCVAVSPKIRFWSRFQRLTISSDQPATIESKSLIDSLEYKKYFPRNQKPFLAEFYSIDPQEPLVIDLPLQAAPLELVFRCSIAPCNVQLATCGETESFVLNSSRRKLSMQWRWPETARARGFFIINNAGSTEQNFLEPADRGFGQVDEGQYESLEPVDLLCGCAVLIRREALLGEPLFISDFFAYFEDTELSKRLTRRGNIIFNPRSVVYHRHSATTQEYSASWQYLVNRNHAIYKYVQLGREKGRTVLEETRMRLSHLREYYTKTDTASKIDKAFARQIPTLIEELEVLAGKADRGELYSRNSLRIGVYNSYWNTFGGGEAHVLTFVQVLQKYGLVDLISEDPFDIARLEKYFGVDLYRTRRRVVSEFTPDMTRSYDVFINSTFWSITPSYAAVSFYIISFPMRKAEDAFLRSYRFLPNSKYTLEWAFRYWGKGRFAYDLVYPSVSEKLLPDHIISISDKEKVILSVGRFFVEGHNKKQLEMAIAFRSALQRYPAVKGWRLVLIGSLNERSAKDSHYFAQVSEIVHECGGEARCNVPLDELADLYKKAAIYLHGAGLNEHPEDDPHCFEHFGMSVVEAAAHGCIPMVYDAAGPAEIVRTLGAGHTWRDGEELIQLIVNFCRSWETERSCAVQMIEQLQVKAQQFRRDISQTRIEEILQSEFARAKIDFDPT